MSLYLNLKAANPTSGPLFDILAGALASAITSWSPTVTTTGISTGATGTGMVTGKLVCPPVVGAVQAGLTSAGINGPNSIVIAQSVALGIANTINSVGGYSAVSAGVGAGLDTSRVLLADPNSLAALIRAGLQGANALLPIGLAQGVCNLIYLVTGTGAVTGPSGPNAGTGVTSGVFLPLL